MSEKLRQYANHQTQLGQTSHRASIQDATSKRRKQSLSMIRGCGDEIIRWAARAVCIVVALDVYFREHSLVWFLVLIGIALGELTISEILKNLGSRSPKD
jgi:hypothetical protein